MYPPDIYDGSQVSKAALVTFLSQISQFSPLNSRIDKQFQLHNAIYI
jgi:hypothetical protein